MRIVQCIPTLLGGGAERQFCYLVEGLVRLGHDVAAVYMTGGPNEARLDATGATRHVTGWRSAYDPRLVADVARVVARTDAQVVQTWMRRMDVVGGLAAGALRRRWVYSERTILIPEPGLRNFVWRRAVLQASAVVANSEGGADVWRGEHPRVFVVPNAVPWEEIMAAPPAARDELGVPEGAELVLYVGRFDSIKNAPFLAEVVGMLLVKRPAAFAVCCGIGPLLPQFRTTIERMGVSPRCLTPGYRDDAWSLMKAADVSVSLSRFEGRPNAVLESMACGVPLVLSDIPQHRECMPAEAIFVRLGDVQGGVGAIEEYLEHRDAARKRASAAASSVRAFSKDAIAKQYARIYEQLM